MNKEPNAKLRMTELQSVKLQNLIRKQIVFIFNNILFSTLFSKFSSASGFFLTNTDAIDWVYS